MSLLNFCMCHDFPKIIKVLGRVFLYSKGVLLSRKVRISPGFKYLVLNIVKVQTQFNHTKRTSLRRLWQPATLSFSKIPITKC